MQLEHAKGIMYVGESETRIYEAALAGAPDMPSEVSEWALEMAQRREGRFRDAVLRSAGFQALMRANAPVAGEVLSSMLPSPIFRMNRRRQVRED